MRTESILVGRRITAIAKTRIQGIALTYGKEYPVEFVEGDGAYKEVVVRDDNGESMQLPANWFDITVEHEIVDLPLAYDSSGAPHEPALKTNPYKNNPRFGRF